VSSTDLVITPDHGSVEYREFEKALLKFANKLRTSNDLQHLGAGDLEIARNEIAQIKEAGSKRSIRAESLWNMTKTSALWIAEKAADGVVKALAIALLAAVATLLGVRIR
jgi:hypothetical protein